MSDGAVVIRPFEPRDLGRLQEIRALAFAPVFASFRAALGEELAAIALADAEEEQAQLLAKICADPDAVVRVAERNACAIGFASILFDRVRRIGEIGLNAVLPSEAGRGVGSALYEHAFGVMRDEGMNAAMVGAGADKSHGSALAAYAKAGFVAGIPSVHLYRKL